MVLTNGQEKGLKIAVERYKNKEPYTVIAGFAGTGKAQPVDTQIPTPNGTKLMGELQAGDYVYDRTGRPTKVLGVYPQGILDCYKVTLSDGRETYCNDQHLWTYYTSKGNFATKTLREMIEYGIEKTNQSHHAHVYAIPMAHAVEYDEKNFDIDPYVIGAFLGNGCCKEKMLTISSNDEETVAEISRLIGAKMYAKNSDFNYSWTFAMKEPIKRHGVALNTKFHTKTFFQNVPELINYSGQKRIPRQYFYGSIQQRLHLIQGLMDTDGYICNSDGGRYNIKYSSTSYDLVRDIQEILLSLGYVSHISKDKRTTKYTTNACYSLHINIDNREKQKLFRLSRKKQIAERAADVKKRRDYGKVYISKVEKMPYQREMVCIYVDNPEHLYLTNDYIVTHNTTLVKYIIEELDLWDDDVVFATLTGKAALVLRDKGNKNAITLHKLLYIPKKIPDSDDVEFMPRSYLEKDYKLIVVDEASMISKEMFDLLLSHKVHVIFLGDNFQLPAISESAHILDNPHVMLTEITRQALDSPIIRLSMDIRDGKTLTYGGDKDARIIPMNKVSKGLLLGADIVLCGKNATRRYLNDEIRKLKWGQQYQTGPVNGDKIICLHNYWKIADKLGNTPLVNGSIGILTDISMHDTKKLKPKLTGVFTDEIGNVFRKKDMNIDYQLLATGKQTVNQQNFREFTRTSRPLEFDYAYAVTCHKYQGSQASKVLCFAECMGDRESFARWLYTSTTRAVDKVVLVI